MRFFTSGLWNLICKYEHPSAFSVCPMYHMSLLQEPHTLFSTWFMVICVWCVHVYGAFVSCTLPNYGCSARFLVQQRGRHCYRHLPRTRQFFSSFLVLFAVYLSLKLPTLLFPSPFLPLTRFFFTLLAYFLCISIVLFFLSSTPGLVHMSVPSSANVWTQVALSLPPNTTHFSVRGTDLYIVLLVLEFLSFTHMFAIVLFAQLMWAPLLVPGWAACALNKHLRHWQIALLCLRHLMGIASRRIYLSQLLQFCSLFLHPLFDILLSLHPCVGKMM